MNPIELAFPSLVNSGYRITSRATSEYNCIAWAAGECDRWWWPDSEYYWPENVPHSISLDAFIAAYATLGYTPTTEIVHEPGVEKIAIYTRDGKPTHASRQLPSGRWTSKLGNAEDIEHAFDDLIGQIYGTISCILARKCATT
jgi:hypothetical protein